ncbi:hypothetical protein [Allosphingosinicella humi]
MLDFACHRPRARPREMGVAARLFDRSMNEEAERAGGRHALRPVEAAIKACAALSPTSAHGENGNVS